MKIVSSLFLLCIGVAGFLTLVQIFRYEVEPVEKERSNATVEYDRLGGNATYVTTRRNYSYYGRERRYMEPAYLVLIVPGFVLVHLLKFRSLFRRETENTLEAIGLFLLRTTTWSVGTLWMLSGVIALFE